ncbi:MAG: NAD(P)-binding protein [Acidilobaceae archaeon]
MKSREIEFHIVGAGLSGLSLARELIDRGFNVRVSEMRDRVGGISVLDSEVVGLIEEISLEVNVSLQATAVKLGGSTVIVSSSGVETIDRGVVAVGFRTATPIELGIVGDRPAGVYPFHAVLDLIMSGLSPGRTIAIYGAHRYSVLLAEKLSEYSRRVYIIDPGSTTEIIPKNIEVIRSKVRVLKGPHRLSEIKLDKGSLEADTLIISIFKPWNPFPEFPPVGHAALETYNPGALLEASRLLAVNLSCEEQTYRRVKVEGEIQVFPKTLTPCLRELLVIKPGGGRIEVNGRVYSISGDYTIVRAPENSRDLRVRVFEVWSS